MTARLPFAARRDPCELSEPQPSLADVLLELRALRRDVAVLAAGRRLPDRRVVDFMAAVDAHFGNGAWRAGELLAWASDPGFAGRRAVLAAIKALVGSELVTAHTLGLRLAAHADTGADGLRLVRVGCERGSRLWIVERLRD